MSGKPTENLANRPSARFLSELQDTQVKLGHLLSLIEQQRKERLALALIQNMPAQHRRLLEYASSNPGAFTHEIARDCGIGNVPCRVSELNSKTLHALGLSVEGRRQSGHVNRFGEPSGEYRWNLVQPV